MLTTALTVLVWILAGSAALGIIISLIWLMVILWAIFSD